MDFQVVERKTSNGTDVKDELVQALIETNDTGKAIKVTLPPDANFINWQSTMRNRLRKHSLRLRIQWTKATRTAVAWTEPMD